MNARIVIKNLDKAESNAKAILEHVDAIKRLQKDTVWSAVSVDFELNEEAVSGN